MRYLSVCSGIEAASVAWAPLGWEPVAFAELEPFPSAVLAHHHPTVPNWGDITRFREWPDATVDLLVGGTPCQSFSVAGLRQGLRDPRGNLALVFLAIADRYRPRWVVWENVPGVLSSDGGRDFGAFLGGLAELGYGFAYRVLDAQYVRVDGHPGAVPQRRRRVFVVGHLGDWRRAAAVLLERESLSGHPPPRREAGKRLAPSLAARTRGGGGLGTDAELDGALIPSVVGTLSDGAHMGGGLNGQDAYTGRVIPVVGPLQSGGTPNGHGTAGINRQAVASGHVIPVAAFDPAQITNKDHRGGVRGDRCHSLHESPPAVAFDTYNQNAHLVPAVLHQTAVRRLTPRECERLQGFPDYYTLVPYRGKPASDGPRYKALGNSMAVNVMAWIGQRIALVESLTDEEAAA